MSLNPQISNEPRKISELAIASMCLGIISLLLFLTGQLINTYPVTFMNTFMNWLIPEFLVLPMGVMAFVFGAISLYKIRKYHKLKGTGMAIAGLVTGGIVAIYGIIMFFLVMLSLLLYLT